MQSVLLNPLKRRLVPLSLDILAQSRPAGMHGSLNSCKTLSAKSEIISDIHERLRLDESFRGSEGSGNRRRC